MATALDDLTDVSAKAHHDKGKGKEGHRLQCVVVTPERTVLDELADFIALPAYDGELGILPGRAPLIARLGFGELRTRDGGQVRRYFVDGGFAQVRDDVVTVLTARAIPVSEINTVTASHELDEAKARRATTESDQADKARATARARALLRLASDRT